MTKLLHETIYYVKINKILEGQVMKSLAVFTILLLVFFGIRHSQEPKMTLLSTTETILAMGDSLTYGFQVAPKHSYPYQLSKMSGNRVINAGINGETSSEGLDRLPKLLEDPSIKIMILCLGANDIIQRQSITALKKNLKEMIQMAKGKGIRVLLVSVPNFTLFGLSDLEIYEKIAKEENVVLAPNILADILEQPSLKIDQVHPNALGYEQMSKMIYARLKDEVLMN